MKIPIINIILLLCPLYAFSQRWFTIDSAAVRIPFQVTEQNQALFITKEKIPEQNLLPVVDVRLSDADLKVDIQTKGVKKGFTYQIDLEIVKANGSSITPDEKRLAAVSVDPGGIVTYVWMDLTETHLDFNGRYILVVKKYLQGQIDCQDKRPEFTIKQQWPHYVAAGAGLGLIGMGQVFRLQKEDAYNTYRSYWSNGLSTEEAKPYWDRANDRESDMRAYTIAGIAILGADALVFAIRQLSVRQKQQQYDKYCAPKAGFSIDAKPFIDFAPKGAASGLTPAYGSKITINF